MILLSYWAYRFWCSWRRNGQIYFFLIWHPFSLCCKTRLWLCSYLMHARGPSIAWCFGSRRDTPVNWCCRPIVATPSIPTSKSSSAVRASLRTGRDRTKLCRGFVEGPLACSRAHSASI